MRVEVRLVERRAVDVVEDRVPLAHEAEVGEEADVAAPVDALGVRPVAVGDVAAARQEAFGTLIVFRS